MQQPAENTLPRPDPESAAHSERCAQMIAENIALSGGSISFAEFMQLALYAPGLGYYAAGATKFGAAGDFVTSPEISSVFGAVVARQCAQLLAECGSSILEFGAGSGRLAVDVLQALEKLDALPERYDIVEVSADLIDRQKALIEREIPSLFGRVHWLDGVPDNLTGVILANEVLDAFPVERFVKVAEGVRRVCVENRAGRFVAIEEKAPDILARAVESIELDLGKPLPIGYVSEVSLGLPGWIDDIAKSLSTGAILLFDYGVSGSEYYAPDRKDGWLRCHFRHHAHNEPLVFPGIQDVTAWVDFSAVAAAADAADLAIAGFVNQAQFLMSGGLSDELAGIEDLPPGEQLALSSAVKTLTLPGEMGENFKCMGLLKNMETVPDAFAIADRTHTL